MSAQIFRHQHRVTYAECTVGNHIYYSRYLDLLEAARGEFFRPLGAPFLKWQQDDTFFPVIQCQLRYLATARYDDVVVIEVWVTKLEKVRLNFAYRILNQANSLLVEASTHHVCASLQDKLKKLPPGLVGQLQPYLHLPAPQD